MTFYSWSLAEDAKNVVIDLRVVSCRVFSLVSLQFHSFDFSIKKPLSRHSPDREVTVNGRSVRSV